MRRSKKSIRLESYKDRLNWGMSMEDVDEEAEVATRDEGHNMSILSSGDEDLILCMTDLQRNETVEVKDEKDDEVEADERAKKESNKKQSNLVGWLSSVKSRKSGEN